MSARTFFRAVNLASDIDNPERLAHYQPTTRSLPVVEAVLGREPTLIVASYGSGKSLAAGVGALIAMNDAKSRPVAERVLQRVKPVDAAAHQRLKARFAARGAGIAVALTGHVEDLPGQLAEWLGAPPKLGSLERVLHWASSNLGRAQHIAIVWDEFGRHLEGLVAEGRSRDLDAVQRIAEWAARAEKPTVSLTLLTHQNLLAYAGGLNQTSRNEWRKVEGRFRTLRFVEDSREIYRVLLDFIGEKRSAPARRFDPAAKDLLLRAAKDSGWIDGAVEAFGGAALVDRAWPVSLGVLHALPRVAARVGQNERSQYAFLETADLSAPVGFEELYRFFSEEMRSDVGPGGSHRRWIETESARAKARNDAEREALAAACLLQLGADGERRRLSRAALEAAVASRGLPAKEAVAAVQSLIDRKLLLHRRAVDDVSVWHGVDVDVGGRLAEERAKVADSFDVVAFLGERRPPPIVRATRHNVEVGAVRYLAGRYVLPQALGRPANGDAAVAETRGPWGDVFYVLAESVSEIADAKAAAAASTRDRTIL